MVVSDELLKARSKERGKSEFFFRKSEFGTCCSRRLEQSTNILGFSLHHDHLRVRTMVSAARGW